MVDKDIQTDSFLEIRPVPDDPRVLRPFVTPEEWDHAMSMGTPARQAEWLAWRALVRERLGRNTVISYDADGAPTVDHGHIGISHTHGWIAAVWSPKPCAVDIELASRDVSRIAARFISEAERALDDAGDPLFAISAWCAKEAAYKLARVGGVDFLRDIRITSSAIADGVMEVSIRDGKPVRTDLLFRDGLVIAKVLELPQLEE